MANLIPNEQTFIGFIPAAPGKRFGLATTGAPTLAEINAAIDLTDYLVSLNASSSGNTVPTPRLKSLFETSIPGTSTATFTGDFYRDNEDDRAHDLLKRGVYGTFIVQRFNGTGPDLRPAAGEETEVWAVQIVSAAAGALSSGTAQMFSLTASVPVEPDEAYVVPA